MNPITLFITVMLLAAGAGVAVATSPVNGAPFVVVALLVLTSLKMANTWQKFVILRGDKTALATDLRPGALVTLGFSPGKGGKPLVQQISILASPGDNFVFSGRIEHLDLRLGLLVLIDPRDDKSYEVNLSPADRSSNRELRQGAQIIVRASFDGKGYTAQDIVAVSPTADK